MICWTCENTIEGRGECHAEKFAPIIDRTTRHSGTCWGGFFPRKKWLLCHECQKRIPLRGRRFCGPCQQERAQLQTQITALQLRMEANS